MEQGHSEEARSGEPTVLDWFRSVLRGDPIPIPELEGRAGAEVDAAVRDRREWQPARPAPRSVEEVAPARPIIAVASPERLRIPGGLLLALVAQIALERRAGLAGINAFIYLGGAALVVWGVIAGDVKLPSLPAGIRQRIPTDVRVRPLILGLVLGLLTFLTAFGNEFRFITVVAWVGSFLSLFVALWSGPMQPRAWWQRLRSWWRHPTLRVNIGRWELLLLGALLLVAWFRFDSMQTVPYEMWSDQAEKLLDVRDVLQGDHRIFFPRNSGREAIEFYAAAWVATTFGTGLSFLTLKLVSTTAGLLSLPLIYLFAKELGGRRVGFFAMVLAGLAFWPNITSRAGLRMPLNELFVAPALFFLIRGIRRGSRNDFLWSGLAIGLGLQGYSGFRVVPLVAALALLLYLFHARDEDRRLPTVSAFVALVLISVVGFLPLLRVLIEMPDQILYRTMTRIGTIEQPYPNPPVVQFLINMWHALTMFAWDSGDIWVVTVPHRPALDWVSGALFHLGIVLVGLAYLRKRRWQHLLLLLSIPILLLPSSLALAFPNENPAPNRVSGAIVPVFTIAAFALDTIYRWAREYLANKGRVLSVGLVGGLLAIAAVVNHQLVFETYADFQRASAWNNSEAGEVMKGFADSVGSFETTYFVVYPFWIDSRLVALEAGAPLRDYSVWPEDLPGQDLDPAQYHLYFIKPEHTEAMALLRELHPRGTLTHHPSEILGRDFFLYLVPPADAPLPPSVEEILG